MDKPISAGDLVQVIRPCVHCANDSDVGKTFVAGRIYRSSWPTDCCGNQTNDLIVEDGDPRGGGQLLSCCKRIPPPEELGIVDEKEEIHA